jgi:uncharacterized protein (TIGR02444 family)
VTQDRADLETDAWAFALRVYANPPVADACLKLQNEAGVDVMMLLVIAFAAVRHRVLLTRSEIGALDDECRPWREQIVQPLRAVRMELKSGPSPAPNAETEQLRSTIKAAELSAERLQNRLLAEHLPLRPPEQETVTANDLRSVLRSLVTYALEKRASEPISTPLSSIDKIVEAAIREA